MRQLTLLEKFDKNEARQLELVELLGKEIGNLKYYRICTAFSDFTGEEKADITECINTILYWVATLAYYQSKGLDKFKKHHLETFLKLTEDKNYLTQTDPHEHEIVREFFNNGHRRMKSLLSINKDLLMYRKKETGEITELYNNLIQL
jgi:hypothetical protein